MHVEIRKVLLMITLAALTATGACAKEPARKAETRCGWWDNPTPQNVSLLDRDGEWIVSIQGGHQADGDGPVFKDSEWVSTNRSYGYGCACVDAVFDRRTHQVVRIRSAVARPLGACRSDPALKRVAP